MKFISSTIKNDDDGYIGRELHRNNDVVARVVFWDAEGQYSAETIGEVPLAILEELIAEAKDLISS